MKWLRHRSPYIGLIIVLIIAFTGIKRTQDSQCSYQKYSYSRRIFLDETLTEPLSISSHNVKKYNISGDELKTINIVLAVENSFALKEKNKLIGTLVPPTC